MTTDFPRLLTLMRKERGISQKDAATDLGVSQALLSHYEKGIRECGLDFLVKAADYYGVSCDYLLGRTPERNGATLTVDELPNPDDGARGNTYNDNIMNMLNKKLLSNSLNILFDLLSKAGSSSLSKQIGSYLNLAFYRAFRILYSANPKNPQDLYKYSKTLSSSYAMAQMEVNLANATAVTEDRPPEGMDKIKDKEALALSNEIITNRYPLFGASLLNLISNTEKQIGKKD